MQSSVAACCQKFSCSALLRFLVGLFGESIWECVWGSMHHSRNVRLWHVYILGSALASLYLEQQCIEYRHEAMWINLKCSRSHGQRETLVIVPLGVGPECRPHELGPQRNAAHFSCSIPLRSWLLHSNMSATRSLDVADQRSASQLWSGFRHESHANLAHWSGSYLSQSSFWILLDHFGMFTHFEIFLFGNHSTCKPPKKLSQWQPALNQKQNWLVSGAYLQTHSDWSGTEIIILRLHIKCIFCQDWFRFYPPCNHVGFKEKPTERVARSCAKRIKNNAQLPSDKTCYVAWTSNAQSEAELALSGAYLQTFRLERHGNHHLETSYQEHLLSSLVSILPVLQPCWVQGKTYRASCPVMCQKNCATHATQAIKITHNFHLTRRAMWHGHLALNQKQNWLVSGAYLQTFRLERHRNHYLETSYQAHLLSSLVSILPALQPCWVQGKTYRACCPVMCQKNRATHATQVAWTSSSQSEAELACIWCLSSDTFRLERHRNHHLETSYQVHLLSSLVSILPALQPCWVQGKTHRACCPVMCQKNQK